MTTVLPSQSTHRKQPDRTAVPPLLRTLACVAAITKIAGMAGIATLAGCASESGHVVSRLPATSAAAPGPAPHTLPPAQVQQQRYDEVDKRALEASEKALAIDNAVKLIPPPPTTNIYNGYPRW